MKSVMNSQRNPFDVAIVGGSYAGLAAALQLARARRRVLVVDEGERRNRFAAHAHGLLGHDGEPPEALVEKGRSQLLAYPTVSFEQGRVSAARRTDSGFSLRTADGQSFAASRLVLATGVRDVLPSISGLSERWGASVFHCPYCHGYELGGRPAAVLASSPLAAHVAMMLPDWGPTTLLRNESCPLEEAEREKLQARGVEIVEGRVERVIEEATVVFADGSSRAFAGLFATARVVPASDLAQQLGCALEESPMGTTVQTSALKETTVPGVFACGDTGLPMGSLALSVGDGTVAGIAAHRSLIFGLSPQ